MAETEFVPPFQRIREAYLEKISEGKLHHGAILPTPAELAKKHRVAMPTMERAVSLLKKDDRLISMEDGRLVVTIKQLDRVPLPAPLILGKATQSMFKTAKHMRLRIRSFTAESLISMIELMIMDIKAGGHRPDTIELELLISDPDGPLDLPYYIDDPADETARTRIRSLIRRSPILVEKLRALQEDGLVSKVSAIIKTLPGVPETKYYCLEWETKENRTNNTLLLTGNYPRDYVLRNGRVVCDTFGWSGKLSPFSGNDPYTQQQMNTFDSLFDRAKPFASNL